MRFAELHRNPEFNNKRKMKFFLIVCIVFISTAVSSQSNYALNFNGTSQYVSIGAPLSNNTSYTKEAWVYSTTNTGARNIISSTNAPFWFNNGILQAGHGGNYSNVADPSAFPLNKWTHVAVTYDAATTTMKLYRDGILINTNTGVASNYTNENTYIGSHAGAGSYVQGMVDEVRIWNVARTQAQLKQNLLKPPANNASGLAAYFKLNDGSGATATNSTGGTNGTLQGSPSWVASPAEHAGNALNFDGVDDIVTIADHNSLDITTAITIEAWVYATKNSGIQNVVSKSSQAMNNGYIFPRTDNGWTSVIMYLYIGSFRTLSAAYPGLNAWHHVAATYDGTTMRLYINGVQAASQAQTGTINANTNNLVFGNQPGYSEYFGGSVDEVRVWNVARTQAQIQGNMNNTLDPATQTGLVSYYTMNQATTAGTNTGMTTVVDMSSENNGALTGFALAGTSSNFIMQNAILPLQWLSFTAQEEDKKVRLDWSTASEQNTRDFIVQHSSNGTVWKNIGWIPAAGNSSTEMKYKYVDADPVSGINFYRIMQNDRDGRSSFSEVRTVKLSTGGAGFTILKNPVDNGVLEVRVTKTTMLSLFSTDGRLLFKKQFSAGTFPISVRNFAKGVYFLKGGDQAERIIVR